MANFSSSISSGAAAFLGSSNVSAAITGGSLALRPANVIANVIAPTTTSALLNVGAQLVGGNKGSTGLSSEEEVAKHAGIGGGVFVVVVVIVFLVLRHFGAHMIGKTIETGIETLDEHYLGVNVNIDNLVVNACRGFVTLEKMVIDNPAGYHNPYLAKIENVLLHVDTKALVLNRGKKVVIESCILKGCDIVLETKFTGGSNLQDILAHVQGLHPAQQEDGAAPEGAEPKSKAKGWLNWCTACGRSPPVQIQADAPGAPAPVQAGKDKPLMVMMMREVKASEVPEKQGGPGYQQLPQGETAAAAAAAPGAAKPAAGVTAKGAPAPKPGDPKLKPGDHDEVEVILKELVLEDIGVKIGIHALGGRGQYTSVADIQIPDLDKQVKSGDTKGGMSMIISLVIKSIEKSVLANVMGKKYADDKL